MSSENCSALGCYFSRFSSDIRCMNESVTVDWTETFVVGGMNSGKQILTYFTFMRPYVVINFFLITNQTHLFFKFVLLEYSTCFGHLLCPSSGVFYCTFGTGKFLQVFDDRFPAESGWNCNSSLTQGPINVRVGGVELVGSGQWMNTKNGRE